MIYSRHHANTVCVICVRFTVISVCVCVSRSLSVIQFSLYFPSVPTFLFFISPCSILSSIFLCQHWKAEVCGVCDHTFAEWLLLLLHGFHMHRSILHLHLELTHKLPCLPCMKCNFLRFLTLEMLTLVFFVSFSTFCAYCFSLQIISFINSKYSISGPQINVWFL